MMNSELQPTSAPMYLVVRSEEGRAAVWPSVRPLPEGWTATDMTGSREECLAYIKLVGDMSSLRHVDTSVAVA